MNKWLCLFETEGATDSGSTLTLSLEIFNNLHMDEQHENNILTII
jgi:hypothetical protein